MKPYYQDKWVTIYHGDCREILPQLPKVDLVLTSPPYDNLREYCGFTWQFGGFPRVLFPLIREGGYCVWVVGDQCINGSESGSSFRQALEFIDNKFFLHDTMIYVKDAIPAPQSNRYNQMFEYMFVFSKGKPNTFNPIQVKSKGYKPSACTDRK